MDAAKLANAVAFWGHDVWSIPLIIVVGTWQLYSYLGVSALVGVFSMVLVLPAQRYCAVADSSHPGPLLLRC